MKDLPEKIYATPNFDRRWQTKAIDDESVEYVRKDAFIEKACEWLLNNVGNYSTNALGAEYMCEDFKKYMKE